MNAFRRAGQLALAVAASGAAATAFAATADATHRLPRQEETASGMTRARAALLGRSDLGRGWFSEPTPNPLHIIAPCRGRLDPHESDLVEVGASSAFFNHGPNVVMQTVSVYRSELDAQAAWSRTLAASPLDCMRTTLAHNGISPERSEALPSPKGVTAYRVAAGFRAHGQRAVLYFDQFVSYRGRITTRVFLTSYTRPFSRAFETKVERTLLQRLGPAGTSITPVA